MPPAVTRPAQAYWADEIAGQAIGRQGVNDSKTPSGTVHVGSLRGVVLHDAGRRAIAERGTEVEVLDAVAELDLRAALGYRPPHGVVQHHAAQAAHVDRA